MYYPLFLYLFLTFYTYSKETMAKTTYKVRDEHADTSICPGVKVIKLSNLSQDQILLLIDQGYSEYFEEVKPKKKDK